MTPTLDLLIRALRVARLKTMEERPYRVFESLYPPIAPYKIFSADLSGRKNLLVEAVGLKAAILENEKKIPTTPTITV